VIGPVLGVRFDIAKVGSGYYVSECWKIFWEAVPAAKIKNSQLSEGDTRATLNGEENVYCIALQNSEASTLASVKDSLLASKRFLKVAAMPSFVGEGQLADEPLVRAGFVECNGTISGESPVAQPALDEVRSGKAGTIFEHEVDARKLPTLRKDDSTLAAFKEEFFELELERHKGSISQEDYEKAKAALDCLLGRIVRRQA
jgi:hypothetical protein